MALNLQQFTFFDLIELSPFVLDFVSCFPALFQFIESLLVADLGIFTDLGIQSHLVLLQSPGSLLSKPLLLLLVLLLLLHDS